MAYSSPGQPRPFDSVGQLTITRSLSDMGEGLGQYGEDTEVLFEEHDAPPASETSPAERLEHQHPLHDSPASHQASTSTMLLEKPSSLFKPLDLDKGYEYGPAVQFAPGYFTTMPGKQAATPRGGEARSPDKRTSPDPTSADRVPIPYFPSRDGGGRTENRTNTKTAQHEPADRPRKLALKPNNEVTARGNSNPVGRSTVTRHVPPPISKPPFPDTSPESSERPFAPPLAPPKLTGALNKLSTRAQVLANGLTQVSEPPSGQKPNVSSPVAHNYKHMSPHHTPLEPGQQAPHPMTRKAERDQKHLHPPMPAAETPAYPVPTREPPGASPSHMANRPLKDWTQVRPARPTHRARPVSRGSNVSKQR